MSSGEPNSPEPQEFTGEAEKPKVIAQPEPNEDERQGLPPSVRVEHAEAPMVLQPEKKNSKGPWIKYNGVATVRVMGPKEWAEQGIVCSETYEWSYMNKKRLPRSLFNDEQLQYMLRVDGRFSLVDN
jgi:hypothetical protein